MIFLTENLVQIVKVKVNRFKKCYEGFATFIDTTN